MKRLVITLAILFIPFSWWTEWYMYVSLRPIVSLWVLGIMFFIAVFAGMWGPFEVDDSLYIVAASLFWPLLLTSKLVRYYARRSQ